MREWRGTSHYQQSLRGGGVTIVNCLRTDKLLVKRGRWGGGGGRGLKIHKNIKERYGGCKI